MSQDNTYKICLLIKPDDHESFDHDSFGTLIESLKLVFFHRRFEVCKCRQPDLGLVLNQ